MAIKSSLPTIISRVFDPPVILTFLTFVAVFISGLHGRAFFLALLLTAVTVILPVFYLLWKIKTHHITNWDMSKRIERIKPLFFLLGFICVDAVIISFFRNAFLSKLILLYFLWTLGFFLVTCFWKISGHTGIASLAACLYFSWFGIQAWPFVFIIFLVSWARWVRKDHTLLQILVGIIYSFIVFSFWANINYV